jgi:hypothetical protein
MSRKAESTASALWLRAGTHVRAHARNFSRRLLRVAPAAAAAGASRETAVCTRASLAETKRAGESCVGEICGRAENKFSGSQIRRARAAKRLRFAAKEQKFVTAGVTNFVVLTPGMRAVEMSRLS